MLPKDLLKNKQRGNRTDFWLEKKEGDSSGEYLTRFIDNGLASLLAQQASQQMVSIKPFNNPFIRI